MKNIKSAVVAALLFSSQLLALDYSVQYKTENRSRGEDQVIATTSRTLGLDTTTQYDAVHISVYDSLYAVFLYRPDSYNVDVVQLKIEQDTVASILDTETELPSQFEDSIVCAPCADPSVQVLITNFKNDMIPTCDEYATKVTTALNSAGIKTVQLRNEQETLENIKSWLGCPNIKMWGRIGHGSDGSGGALILGAHGVPTGYLRASEIAALGSVWKGKMFPFNSCYIGGDKSPIIKNMVASGALFGVGGNNVSLGATYSEPHWAKFMIEITVNKTEIGKASRDILAKAALAKPGKGGSEFATTFMYPGAPLFFGSTVSIPSTKAINTQPVKVSVSEIKSGKMSMIVPHNGLYSIQLYSLNGRELHNQSAILNEGVNSIDLVGSISNQRGIVKVQGEGILYQNMISIE